MRFRMYFCDVRVFTVPWLIWGSGFATPWCIVTLTRTKRNISDLQFFAHLAHEFKHVEQWRELGVMKFVAIYAYDCIVHGYHSKKHRIEEPAREAARAYLRGERHE